MEHFYRFAIVRFSPDKSRGESLNVAVLIFSNDSLDVRVSRRLERVRAFSGAVDLGHLAELINNLKAIDDRNVDRGLDVDARAKFLSVIGPLSLGQFGTLTAGSVNAYEDRVAEIMRAMIDAEPASPRHREKKSKLLTQVKTFFRQERVLAKKDEGLDSHRIVAGFELDQGLVADLALKNGAMHIIETIDASGDELSLKKAIGEIGTAALVLERARMKFGENKTKARLVYVASPTLERIARPSLDAAEHQGAEIVNWNSADDRGKFIHSLASLATPIEKKSANRYPITLRQEPLKLR